jgi:hypothetical protein
MSAATAATRSLRTSTDAMKRTPKRTASFGRGRRTIGREPFFTYSRLPSLSLPRSTERYERDSGAPSTGEIVPSGAR